MLTLYSFGPAANSLKPLLALYENVTVDTPRGRIRILDLRTSTLVATSIPEDTSDFQWQPAAQ